jgi:Uma2 family endonuclease
MMLTFEPLHTEPLLLDVSNTTLTVTPAEFDLLCANNPDLRLELTKDGELIVMTPAFPISGKTRRVGTAHKPFRAVAKRVLTVL